MKKKILILCNANPDTDPRPNRMIHYLKDTYQITVLGRNEAHIKDVVSFGFFYLPTENLAQKRLFLDAYKPLLNFLKQALKKIVRVVRLVFRQYEDIVWSQLGHAKAFQDKLAAQDYDLIISHDISLMPLVRNITSDKTKVILDAREFYPKNFDDQWQWRLTIKPVNIYLCKTYLPFCNKVITVSKGLSHEYKREFGVDSDVIMSLPNYKELSPSYVDPEHIRIIHHGYASYSRRTEVMIEMMDYLDERFSLDLMLLFKDDAYNRKIVSMAKQRRNVRMIPPVRMQDIVPFTNQYDIGLFLCPPTNFNLRHALPNKFFEFIQARLAVAIGPGVEMKEIVEQYGCGIVSNTFDPASLAIELNHLTPEKIMEYKQKSDIAAKYLNADANRNKILNMVQDLLQE